MSKRDDPTVKSLVRAFRILDTLSHTSLGLTKSEISRRLKIPYSTTFNLLATMDRFGYVRKDEDTGKYHLGLKLLSFGGGPLPGGDLRALVAPRMDELVRRTRLTSHLAVLDRGEAVYIDKREPPDNYFRINSFIGKRNYVHTSAVGKALIAHRPAAEVREIWRRGLPQRTSKTVTSLRKFQAVLGETRRRGYAIDDEEDELGGRCVAAPIFDAGGAVVATVSLSGHISNMPDNRIPLLGAAIVEFTAAISAKLGHSKTRSR